MYIVYLSSLLYIYPNTQQTKQKKEKKILQIHQIWKFFFLWKHIKRKCCRICNIYTIWPNTIRQSESQVYNIEYRQIYPGKLFNMNYLCINRTINNKKIKDTKQIILDDIKEAEEERIKDTFHFLNFFSNKCCSFSFLYFFDVIFI